MTSNDLSFLNKGSLIAAPQLLGWRLYHVVEGQRVGGMIIETEAYTQSDAASHSYRGRTPRTDVMFGPAGHLYVYFTYGMHHCMNIVTGEDGIGDAVLIRAILPDEGLETMRPRRNNPPEANLANGPGKLCQALGVTLADNGKSVLGPEFVLLPPLVKVSKPIASPRIGITKAVDRLWRFTI